MQKVGACRKEVPHGTSYVFLPIDMIFDCLTSELQIGRVATAQSETLGNFAKILVSRTGRQNHSVVLGS